MSSDDDHFEIFIRADVAEPADVLAVLFKELVHSALPAGAEILIEGYQAKDGSNRANGRDITFADGRKLFLGSESTGAPNEKSEK